MYGVPAELDLSAFVGATLERIDLGQWIVHFRFAMEPRGAIGVEGRWELLDASGAVVDRSQEPPERECYRLHHLLLRDVTTFDVHAPEWFSLTFDNGMALRVYDESRQYESFSIEPGDIHI